MTRTVVECPSIHGPWYPTTTLLVRKWPDGSLTVTSGQTGDDVLRVARPKGEVGVD